MLGEQAWHSFELKLLFFLGLGKTLLLFAVLLDEISEHAEFFILSVFKVKLILRTKTNLVQVVVERLLGHLGFARRVLESVTNQCAVWAQNTVVKAAPDANLVNDFFDRALFDSLELRGFLLVAHSCHFFALSLVAFNWRLGGRKWHFQGETVRHRLVFFHVFLLLHLMLFNDFC